MLTLYHFTSKETAEPILTGGFAGDIWLSPNIHTVCGEQARGVLLEVTFDCPEAELEPYRREVREEEIDGVTDEPVAGGDVDIYDWYEVPAEFISTKGKVRAIGPEERRRLWLEG